jgi:uncharacterized metal-binding protein
VAGLTLTIAGSSDRAFWVAAGFGFGGLMFGPDLDIKSVQLARWGIFRWIWYPYRRLLRHRSFFSHGPIVGTLLRLVYLGLWIAVIGAFILGIAVYSGGGKMAAEGMAKIPHEIGKYIPQLLAVAIGLELGAMSHYLADTIVSAWKKHQKHRR